MIPIRYQNAKFDDVPEQIRELLRGMEKSRRGVYIYGDVGTGKTHIVYAMKAKSPSTLVWNTTELFRALRQDFDRLPRYKEHLDRDLMEWDRLLVLDDIGAEKISDWVMETFYLLVNKRYNDMMPTIFTSNYSPQDLSERIGDRTVSRIVEMCDIVELAGADRRVQTERKKITISH